MRPVDVESYTPAFQPGQPLTTFGCGEVVRSECEQFPKGALIVGISKIWALRFVVKTTLTAVIYLWKVPMQAYSVIPGQFVKMLPLQIAKNDQNLPFTTLIGGSGMPGQTAYWSFYNLSDYKKGDTIFGELS